MNLDEVLEGLRTSGLAADPSPASIVLPVFRLRDIIWRGDKEIARQHGLTWAEFETLATLRHARPHDFTPSELCTRLGITSGGLTKILKTLEGNGHIQVRRNEDDGRSRFVRLSPKGKCLAETIISHFEQANCRKFGAALSRQEHEQLSSLLRKLTGVLEAQAGSDAP